MAKDAFKGIPGKTIPDYKAELKALRSEIPDTNWKLDENNNWFSEFPLVLEEFEEIDFGDTE